MTYDADGVLFIDIAIYNPSYNPSAV